MATETIEAVWRGGKIIPLEEVEVEEGTAVTVTIFLPTKQKKSLLSLAGVWSDYRTPDGKSIDDVKKEIYFSREMVTRKEVIL